MTMSRIIDSFTLMAILISCLGLFGLAAFNAEQRTKEIGIRKVMGASIPRIVRLLSIDFLKLVFIAFLLATPITWLIMNKWLAVFAYHIGIHWWIFSLSGGIAVSSAMIIVSFQAFKAAIVNPVKSLRQ
jgi:putative ABC transport system permease protein